MDVSFWEVARTVGAMAGIGSLGLVICDRLTRDRPDVYLISKVPDGSPVPGLRPICASRLTAGGR